RALPGVMTAPTGHFLPLSERTASMGRMHLSRVTSEPRRFYDGGVLPRQGVPGLPPDPSAPPRIVLERHTDSGLELFSLERRIAYLDRHLGELLVPARVGFRTDLTSTPAIFTWLVPKTGAHLPAALLHDGLVEQDHGDERASYTSTDGYTVDRVEADRVFRDAMADTGTGVVRRWIVWAAVTLASFFVGGGTPWSTVKHWRYRLAAAGTIGVIAWLGWCATADLFDVSWPLATQLPWMGDRSFVVELAGGLAGAIVVSLALSVTWGRFWVAGAIGGVILAVLLHVTVGVAVLLVGYQLAERLAHRAPLVALGLAALVALAAVGLFAALSLG
ncbi:MAG TPA: DUF1353 domain-containing protein, partial [Nocardioides sp.]